MVSAGTQASIVAALLVSGCVGEPRGHDLVIRGAAVVDVREARVRPGTSVRIEADRIAEIGPDAAVAAPPGAEVLEAAGRFLIPGLWDMHTHALWGSLVEEGYLALFVAHGVTGIRDMGGELEVLRSVKSGAVSDPAPRIVASGPWLNSTELDPRAGRAVGSATEARRVVAELAAAGADLVKVYLQLPPDAFQAVIEEAGRLGLPVAGHVPLEVGAAAAAAAGMRSIEHLQAEIGGYCDPRGGGCDELFELFRRHRTWQTPTLTVRRNRAYLDDPGVFDAPALRWVPPRLRQEWRQTRESRLAGATPAARDEVRRRYEAERRLAAAAIDADLPILAGSDAGELYSVYGASLHDELERLVEAGMTAGEALRAATLGAAQYQGREAELGTVEEGKLADLVLLRADPLERIGHTREIDAVVLGGRLWTRFRLDELLARLARGDP